MYKLFATLIILFSSEANAQKCNCFKKFGNGEIIDLGSVKKNFTFSNKKNVAVCGDMEVQKGDTIYSEGFLSFCDENKIIEEWGALDPCKIRKINDTIFVETLCWLPIGKNYKTVSVPFYSRKYFFYKDSVYSTNYIINYRKYSKKQILQILQQYKKITKGNSDYTITVANRLFWSCVSGSKKAEELLLSLPIKFKDFDGAYAEDFDDIVGNYKLWKKTNNRKQFFPVIF